MSLCMYISTFGTSVSVCYRRQVLILITLNAYNTQHFTSQHHPAPFRIFLPPHANPHLSALSRNVRYRAVQFRTIQGHSTAPRSILHLSAPFRTTAHQSAPSNIIRHHHTPLSTILQDPALSSATKHQCAHSRALPHNPTPFSTISRHSAQSSTILPHHAPFRSCIVPSIYLLAIHTPASHKTTYPQIRELITLPNHQPTNPSFHHHINAGANNIIDSISTDL